MYEDGVEVLTETWADSQLATFVQTQASQFWLANGRPMGPYLVAAPGEGPSSPYFEKKSIISLLVSSGVSHCRKCP